jgi:hypothetical protein
LVALVVVGVGLGGKKASANRFGAVDWPIRHIESE